MLLAFCVSLLAQGQRHRFPREAFTTQTLTKASDFILIFTLSRLNYKEWYLILMQLRKHLIYRITFTGTS